jgi:hypothetical protein
MKIDFRVLQLLNELSKCQRLFSVGYILHYNRPGVIYSLSQVQIFLAMRGTTAPFEPRKQKGAHPPSGNPLMYLFDRGGAEKVITFLAIFPKRKTVFGA